MSKALHIRDLPGLPDSLKYRTSEPFMFPPAGKWSADYANRFENEFQSRFNQRAARLQPELVPVARYAWLIRSLGNLPRNGSWQDEKLCEWAAGLVEAVIDSDTKWAGAKTLWCYPTGLQGTTLQTLVAMQMYIPPSMLSPLTCRTLLLSLSKELLGNAHAALRQDGYSNCLLWLDSLEVKSCESGKHPQRSVLDSLLDQPASLERLMECQASSSVRGAQARQLMRRLADRADENPSFDFSKGKSSSKLTDEAWISRPVKQLAHKVALPVSADITTGCLEASLQDIARMTRRSMPAVIADFSKHFCLAIADGASTTQWHTTSEWLVGPPLRPNAPPILTDVFALLKLHNALDVDFAARFRKAFFEVSKPDLFAGRIVMARLTALDMELQIAEAELAEKPIDTAPRHRRLGL